MNDSAMVYPFGRCAACGRGFNSELREEYEILHCPWCGELILDYINDINPPLDSAVKVDANRFIYCEACGTRIYERHGKGGEWIEDGKNGYPGVCSGPCERELCGNCADWDVNGECEQCRNSPCGQCPNHEVVEMCQECEHLPERKKWADYVKPDPCDSCGVHSEVGCMGCLEKLG
jgi:DNA-directed RNA polymerase subunit RPC12/RpoP